MAHDLPIYVPRHRFRAIGGPPLHDRCFYAHLLKEGGSFRAIHADDC